MIEQHQYGCSIQVEGDFRNNYNTIASSPELKMSHIEEYFEPLCAYAINIRQKSEYRRNIINETSSLIIAHIPTGELLVGQINEYDDGENERERFFIHNYILSSSEKIRYIKMPEKIFGATQFETSYNIENKCELGILAAIPYQESNLYFRNREELFDKMNVNNEYFKKLMEAIVVAVNYDKRVWIVTGIRGKERELCIRGLMYHIYRELPWCICEKIGVVTAGKWRICCPNIHVSFLEENDTYDINESGSDYIFDFVKQKFFNIDDTIDLTYYFNMVNLYRNNKVIYEKLNTYIYEIIKATGERARRNIGIYNYVSTVIKGYVNCRHNMAYTIEKGEREGLIAELIRILMLPIKIDIKREMQDLIIDSIVSLELNLKSGILFELEEIEAIIELIKNTVKDKEKVYDKVKDTILMNIKEAYNQGENKYIESVFECLKTNNMLYQEVVSELYKIDELKVNIIYSMLEKKFSKCSGMSGMLLEMEEIEDMGSLLLEDEYYAQIVSSNSMEYIESSNDIYGLFMFVKTYCKDKKGDSWQYILKKVEESFIKQINFNHINTEEELLQIDFVYEYEDEKYIAIKQYKGLIKDIKKMSPNNLVVNKVVQEKIKYLYRNLIRQDRYYMLVYAFLEKDDVREEGWKVNLISALEYLYQISSEDVLQFIIWMKDQRLYVEYDKFDDQVIAFLNTKIITNQKVDYKLVKRYLANNSKTKILSKKIRNNIFKSICKSPSLGIRIKRGI